MKKNKLTFIIAASFLALGALVGCEASNPTPNSNNVTSNDQGSEVIGGSSVDSGTSQGGGNTSQDGGSTSQGGGNTSQGGGTDVKTDWSDGEKAIMRQYLHGYVLPFVGMDVSVNASQSSGTIKIESQANMASDFLSKYAAIYNEDEAWDGGDISNEYGVSFGNAFAYRRKVSENNKNYYIAVMFTGLEFTPGQEEPHISKDGKFYLEAADPYVYEFPAAFIGQWLSQVYTSTIVPPAFEAEYYSLQEEGVLYGYSERNIESDYKTIVERTGNYTIDANKNSEGYYVCRPNDGTYLMLFKYDAQEKVMILKVESPKGWNVAAINAIFNKYHVTPFALPAIADQNIGFNVSAMEAASGTFLTISVTKVNTQMVQTFVNGLKTLGYKVASSTVDDSESQWFTTANVFTSTGMFTLYITYSKSGSSTNLEIMCNLDANPNVTTNWPAASIARYLDGVTGTLPAFAGTCYGYSYTITNTYSYVTVHVDEGSESAAKDSYVATLTANKYVASGTIAGQSAFKSEDGHILVAISCKPDQYPGEIEILIQEITIVDTPWPTAGVADAVDKLAIFDPITDTIPALDVSSADSCYVNDNYSTKFEIVIEGLASNEAEFVAAFKAAGWKEDPYYAFDSTVSQYGVLISPNNQMVAMFDAYESDLSIYVKLYFDQAYDAWPSQEINTYLNKWGISRDTLPAFNNGLGIYVNEVTGEQKIEIEIGVGSTVRQTALTEYCVALERIGYHYDQTLGGHISDNHELLVVASIELNGIKLVVSNVTMGYKVVGYNGNWTVAEGLAMTDATNPDENYDLQYSASFHVDANAKFKIVDSDNTWYGNEIAGSNSNVFGTDADTNITVSEAGTVTVYFKIYEDKSKAIWLEFVKDQPALVAWPTEAINAQLEAWEVDDEIPVLQDASITDVQFVAITEKSFALTVYGGASLISSYNDLLGASFTYNNEKEGYVSENLLIKTHADQDNLVVAVFLLENEPELEPWPEEALLEYFGEDTFVSIPEIKIAGASYHFEYTDEDGSVKVFYMTVTVADAPTKMAAVIQALENEYSYAYDHDIECYISSSEGLPAYAFDPIDDQSFGLYVAYFQNEVEETVYKLVGPFNDWDYENADG